MLANIGICQAKKPWPTSPDLHIHLLVLSAGEANSVAVRGRVAEAFANVHRQVARARKELEAITVRGGGQEMRSAALEAYLQELSDRKRAFRENLMPALNALGPERHGGYDDSWCEKIQTTFQASLAGALAKARKDMSQPVWDAVIPAVEALRAIQVGLLVDFERGLAEKARRAEQGKDPTEHKIEITYTDLPVVQAMQEVLMRVIAEDAFERLTGKRIRLDSRRS